MPHAYACVCECLYVRGRARFLVSMRGTRARKAGERVKEWKLKWRGEERGGRERAGGERGVVSHIDSLGEERKLGERYLGDAMTFEG